MYNLHPWPGEQGWYLVENPQGDGGEALSYDFHSPMGDERQESCTDRPEGRTARSAPANVLGASSRSN